MPNSFKSRLLKLAWGQKITLFASFFIVIGAFLPWYADIDRFNTGDTFLGITGPLYLAGLIVLMAGSASFSVVLMKLLEKPIPKLPLSEKHFHILNSAISIVMLVLASSVYFHPKFGVNLTDKTAGIGLIFAFVGSGLLIIAVFVGKKTAVSFDTKGHLEPLINMTGDRKRGEVSTKSIEREQNVSQAETKVSKPVQATVGDLSKNMETNEPKPYSGGADFSANNAWGASAKQKTWENNRTNDIR